MSSCTAEPAGGRWRLHRPAASVPCQGSAFASAFGPQAAVASPGTAARGGSCRSAARAGDAEAARGGFLAGDAAERPLRGGAHGGPERAGLETVEPPPRCPALLHADAACPGLPQGRQLPPREPLRRGLSRGPPAHRAGERRDRQLGSLPNRQRLPGQP